MGELYINYMLNLSEVSENNFFSLFYVFRASKCFYIFSFYPTALNGCWGIVFTHGVQMVGRAGVRAGGWAGGWAGGGK